MYIKRLTIFENGAHKFRLSAIGAQSRNPRMVPVNGKQILSYWGRGVVLDNTCNPLIHPR